MTAPAFIRRQDRRRLRGTRSGYFRAGRRTKTSEHFFTLRQAARLIGFPFEDFLNLTVPEVRTIFAEYGVTLNFRFVKK